MPQIRDWLTGATRVLSTPPPMRKPYVRPEIVLELELETRAGSPLLVDPLVDPLSPVKSQNSEAEE